MSMWTDRELKALISRVDVLEKLFNQLIDNNFLASNPVVLPHTQVPAMDKRTKEYKEYKEWKNANS